MAARRAKAWVVLADVCSLISCTVTGLAPGASAVLYEVLRGGPPSFSDGSSCVMLDYDGGADLVWCPAPAGGLAFRQAALSWSTLRGPVAQVLSVGTYASHEWSWAVFDHLQVSGGVSGEAFSPDSGPRRL